MYEYKHTHNMYMHLKMYVHAYVCTYVLLRAYACVCMHVCASLTKEVYNTRIKIHTIIVPILTVFIVGFVFCHYCY